MRKRLLITLIFAVVIALSISSCNGEESDDQEGVPDTISVADRPSGWPADTIPVERRSTWPPDTIMVSFKNASNDLKIGEYVKINDSQDTLGWPSDSVTSIRSFSNYYLNEVYDATK